MFAAWAMLFTAVLTEIAWGCFLKAISFFKTGPLFLAVPLILSCINMYLLARAMRVLPSGLSYIIWTTLGAVGIICAGVLFFGESFSKAQVFFCILCIVGVVGLKLCSPS